MMNFIKGWVLSNVLPLIKLINPINWKNLLKLMKLNAILLHMFTAEKLETKGKLDTSESRKARVLKKLQYMVAGHVVNDTDNLDECIDHLVKALDCLKML